MPSDQRWLFASDSCPSPSLSLSLSRYPHSPRHLITLRSPLLSFSSSASSHILPFGSILLISSLSLSLSLHHPAMDPISRCYSCHTMISFAGTPADLLFLLAFFIHPLIRLQQRQQQQELKSPCDAMNAFVKKGDLIHCLPAGEHACLFSSSTSDLVNGRSSRRCDDRSSSCSTSSQEREAWHQEEPYRRRDLQEPS